MGEAAVKVYRIDRPSDPADELHLYLPRVHDCPLGRKGLVIFPVGHYGQGMPLDEMFEVHSTEPCTGCGKYLRIAVAWKGPKVIDMSAK